MDTADFRILSRTLEAINRERQKAGAPPVGLSQQLCQAAQAHCADMIRHGYFAERGPDGVDVGARVAQTGYKGKSAANLAMGPESVEEAMTALMGDPQNRAMMLDAKHQHLGVGCHEDAWAVIFASPDAKPVAGAPTESTATTLLELVNRERGRVQRFPLRVSEQLTQAAQAHALEMYSRGFISARSPDGTTISDRVKRAGFDGRTGACVLSGAQSAEQALEVWMKDDGNRNNVLNGEFRHLGAGHVNGRWVLVLGTPPLAANASPELAGAVLELVNRHRGRAQVPARELGLSEYLNQAAQDHARDMVVKDYCGAVNPANTSGGGIVECVDRAGFRGATAASFAKGPVTAEAVVEMWMNSEADRANLLSPKYRELGVGVVESRWALILGNQSAESVTVTPELRARMLEAINIERARALVAPVTMNDRLNEAAQAHSADMARRDFNGSTNPDGQGPADRVKAVRYPFRSLVEFTSVDQPNVAKIIESWMQSPGHRAHLLNKELVHVGLGVERSRWTVILARS